MKALDIMHNLYYIF